MTGEIPPEIISAPRPTGSRPKVRENQGLATYGYAPPFAVVPPAARPFRLFGECYRCHRRAPPLPRRVRPQPFARMRSFKGRAAGAIAPPVLTYRPGPPAPLTAPGKRGRVKLVDLPVVSWRQSPPSSSWRITIRRIGA